MDAFRPVGTGSSQILTGYAWFRVIADGSGGKQIALGGLFQVIADGFGWFWVVCCFSSYDIYFGAEAVFIFIRCTERSGTSLKTLAL